MNHIEVENYYDGSMIDIELDVRMDVKENAKKYFQ